MGDIVKFKNNANNLSVADYKRNVQKNYIENQSKRNIKNSPSKRKHKTARGMGKKIAMLIVAGTLALGGVACQGNSGRQVDQTQGQETTVTTIENREEKIENEIKEAQQDFLKRYITAYNENHNMDYKIEDAQILTNHLVSGYVFKVNEKCVTPGKNPDITQEKLSKFGNVEIEYGHEKVMQIVVETEEGNLDVLVTLDADTLETMYSGNQLEDVKNNKKLLELIEVGINKEMGAAMAGIAFGKGNESLESLEQRVNKYNNAKEARDAEFRSSIDEKDDGYEIGD